MDDTLIRLVSYSAYAAAIASIISFAALIIFFAGYEIFGPINDAVSVLQFLLLIPVALVLYQHFRDRLPMLSGAITLIAVLSMLVIAILQGALVLRFVRFEQTLSAVLFLSGLIGLWWLVVGIAMLPDGTFPAGLAWVSIAAGLGLMLTAVGFWLGGQQHPLAAIGFLVGAVAVPVWAIWLGRLMSSGGIGLPAAV